MIIYFNLRFLKMIQIKFIMQKDAKKKWFVLYTKPRGEKKLSEQLNTSGIEAYCPTRTEVRVWSDRKKKVEMPVLPSMLLVKIENKQRAKALESPLAMRYLFWNGKPSVVTQVEVDTLRSILGDSKFESHELDQLRPGQKLDMTELGFENIEGTVQYVNKKECWVVLQGMGYVVKFKR
jgi:transcriptional antiterminator RfaH